MKKKIAAVVGPTASGKTALSIELAKELNGEIISCDSMQIYKKMDIGTAKPTIAEMGDIPHHLIDIVDPCDNFSCADYAELAKAKIEEIADKGKMPIFCGGTGLYIDHVLSGTSFSAAGKDDKYREALQKEADDFGVEFVYEKLKKIDPAAAEATHPNNLKRVIRALEIFHVSGKTKTQWDTESKSVTAPYDPKIIFLDYRDREKLYSRIDKRVDIMIECGLVDEVKYLVETTGARLSDTAYQAIGYKEVIAYLNGECSLEQAIDSIKQNSRNYAKRQVTWFKRNGEALRLYVDDYEKFDDIVNIAKNMLTH